MVAQHYRWNFIGLSTDSKPDSSDPKVANGSTYYESDTSKLYVWYNNEWYEKTATGGGGGGITQLTSADYDFPNSSPEYVAIWRLPQGIYQTTIETQFATANDVLDYFGSPATFIINKNVEEGTGNTEARIYVFSNNFNGVQITVSYPSSEIDGGNGGSYSFTLEQN